MLMAGLLAAALPGPGYAQLAQPRPAPLGPVSPQPIGPTVSRVPVVPSVNADLAQRPADSAPIRATGPAQEPELRLEAASDAAGPSRRAPATLPVLDATGRPLPGVIRVAPNRVFDPGSGRYYWTVGSGAGERVVP
jgi:hypothetical protein